LWNRNCKRPVKSKDAWNDPASETVVEDCDNKTHHR